MGAPQSLKGVPFTISPAIFQQVFSKVLQRNRPINCFGLTRIHAFSMVKKETGEVAEWSKAALC